MRRPRIGSLKYASRVGLDEALTARAEADCRAAVDPLVRRETIRLVEQRLSPGEAEAVIERLQRDDLSDDEARQLVELVAEQQRDARTRKVRKEWRSLPRLMTTRKWS